MSKPFARALLISALLCAANLSAASAQQSVALTSPIAKNDYSSGANWLCRPDRKPGEQDACAVDLNTTVVAADGTTTRETWQSNPKPDIDCFYVYPTVSNDTTPNSDMIAGPEERSVVQQQFARFASQCRLFVPLYRQVTLPALRAMISGQSTAMNLTLGYNDALDAWNYYLKHDNNGRGVVLIGHSQGSSVLTELIAKEIDGKPVQEQLVSALLLGWNIAVPKGKDVGGAFKSIPLCHAVNQTGCLVAYSSFRADLPPPANTRFGKVPGEGMMAACVNPAAIGGGPGALHAYLNVESRARDVSGNPVPWVKGGADIATRFVSVPGLLSGECVNNEFGSYLAVTIDAMPDDPRADNIGGDVMTNGVVMKDWGLHLIDMNLSMGNLVGIVHEQSKMYMRTCACKERNK